jgi:hypothetical protein
MKEPAGGSGYSVSDLNPYEAKALMSNVLPSPNLCIAYAIHNGSSNARPTIPRVRAHSRCLQSGSTPTMKYPSALSGSSWKGIKLNATTGLEFNVALYSWFILIISLLSRVQ